MLRHESMKRIDRYSVAARVTDNLNRHVFTLASTGLLILHAPRWIDFRSSVIGGLLLSGLSAVLLYGSGVLPGAQDAGFVLFQATGLNFMIMTAVKLLNMFQVNANR